MKGTPCVLNLWPFSSVELGDQSPDVVPVIVTFQETQGNSTGALDTSHLASAFTHTQLAKPFPTLLDSCLLTSRNSQDPTTP